ncbi:MAG TPA: hypothetical protein VGP90_03175, partial [Acidimicrobiia bacterium]|nr:hypothetical protein [Acidimicrobiia bacterium]
RGPSALEASERALPETVVSAAMAAAGDGPHVLVGAGWDEPAVNLPDFFARVAAWATAARPGPFPFTGVPLVNTDPDYGAAALRTLLLAAPERAVLVVPRRHLDDLTMAILSVAYDIDTVPAGPDGDPAVVTAVRHDRPPGDEAHAVLRHIVLHPGAKVVNAWRDALLALARDAGTPLTKNEARARIAADRLPPGLRLLRPWELPVSAFETLKAAIIPESDEGTGR